MSKLDRNKLGEWLSAYIDDELSADQRRQVEQLIDQDGEARRLLDELLSVVEGVSALPRHRAPDSIAEQVQVQVERAALLGDPGMDVHAEPPRRSVLPPVLATAAVISLLVGGLWVLTGESEMMSKPGDRRVALAPAAKSEPVRSLSVMSSRRSKQAKALLASATLDQKLRAGAGLDAIRTHSFGNESIRLNIVAKDGRRRNALAKRIVAGLSLRGIKDLSNGATAAISASVLAGGFFLEGKVGENFNEEGERQVMVRATLAQLDELMKELSLGRDDVDVVSLSSGPVAVKGLRRSRAALSGIASASAAFEESFGDKSSPRIDQPEKVAFAPARRSTSRRVNPWSGLLKVVVPGADLLAQSAADRSGDEADGAMAQADTGIENRSRKETKTAVALDERAASADSLSEPPLALRRSPLKLKKIESAKDRRSLVERRLEAARSARGRRSQPEEMPTILAEKKAASSKPSMAVAVGKPGDKSFVTIIIHLKATKPPAPASKTTSPKPKSSPPPAQSTGAERAKF